MSTEQLPVPDFHASPVWQHQTLSPQRTVFVSDSCLSAYDTKTQDCIVVTPKQGKRVKAVYENFVRILRSDL